MAGSPLLPRLLFIEDDEVFATLVARLLAPSFEVLQRGSAEDGWQALQADRQIDVILLDRNLPGMDGLDFMGLLREDPGLRRIPVVMQTGLATPEAIAEGIEAGVFYYLAKPVDRRLLASVLAAALADSRRWRELKDGLEAANAGAGFMTQGTFRIRTPEDVQALSPALARAYPDPDRVLVGISELLMNAVEHGNLGLDCDAKARHMEARTWKQELARRLQAPPWAERIVEARFHRLEDRIELTIADQGEGFDWVPFLELRLERALEPNGRGIAMARHLSFDGVAYEGRGNVVQAVVRLEPADHVS